MNGNVTFAGLNFQERVEEEHLKKEGNNGEIRLSRFSRLQNISCARRCPKCGKGAFMEGNYEYV